MTAYLITGARGGVGSALAKRVAGAGVVIALVDSKLDSEMQQIASSCRDAGAEVIVQCIDVREGREIEVFIHDFATSQGRLDVVIACAGESSGKDDDGLSIESVRRITDVNYFGAINTFLPAVQIMKEQGFGSIISINSIGALVSTQNSAAYSASKAALKMWIDSLRLRMWGSGVHITDIVLGFVDTPMTEGLSHARMLSIDSDRAAIQILRASRNQVAVASIPFMRNVPWWLMKMVPNTPRGYLLTRIWRRLVAS